MVKIINLKRLGLRIFSTFAQTIAQLLRITTD